MNSTLSSACICRRAELADARGSGRGEGVPALTEAAGDATAAGCTPSLPSSSSCSAATWLGERDQRRRPGDCEPSSLVMRGREARTREVAAALLLPAPASARCAAREVEARAASGMLAPAGGVR